MKQKLLKDKTTQASPQKVVHIPLRESLLVRYLSTYLGNNAQFDLLCTLLHPNEALYQGLLS